MDKPVYIVHLHRIEDSYYFGAFSSISALKIALQEYFKNDMSNPWKDSYLDDLYNLEENHTIDIDIKTVDWGWDFTVCILYQKLDIYYKGN